MDRTIELRLVLELTEDGHPSGDAIRDDGASRRFSGWLGLVSAIDALLGDRGVRAASSHDKRRRNEMLTYEKKSTHAALGERLAGEVVLAGDPGWDEARGVFNLLADQRPAMIALPRSAADVAEVIRYARGNGLRVAPQGSGHNAMPLSGLDEAVLLRTTRMTGVEIDAGRRTVRAEAGVRWGDVVPQLSRLGLAALHGSSPSVGIVGYTLGGGVGWYARRHGLAANSVTAIEIVTAEGRELRVDAEREPELFWALRGGGGNLGVVTAIEFDVFEIGSVFAGALFFEWERAAEVLHAWNGWIGGVPDEVTSVGRLLQVPSLEEIPEPLRGRSFAVVEAAYLGDAEDGAELIAPLRDLGPEIDTFGVYAPEALGVLHMDPPEPVPVLSATALTRRLPGEGIDRLLAAAGPGSGSELSSVEMRHTGGALGRSAPSHGALASLPGEIVMFAVSMPQGEESARTIATQLGRVSEALAPYEVGRYLNFVEEPVDAATAYPAATLERLRAARAAADPDGVMLANHPIDPAPRA